MSIADAASTSGQPVINDSIRAAAIRWIIRRDRGLSAAESIEFELWLAADERHAAAVRRSTAAWSMLNRIPDEVGQPIMARAVRRGHWRWSAISGLAAALAIAYIGWWRTPAIPAAPTVVEVTSPRIMNLSDGTIVRLNIGSEVVERFTSAERRVTLVRGEAHFTVTKNLARPFIVRAGNIEARAVGTAFNVILQSTTVEVLVTEGRVQVNSEQDRQEPTNLMQGAASIASESPPMGFVAGGTLLTAGERTVVSLFPTAQPLQVAQVPPEQMSQALAWQEPLLRLGGATLAELAAEFERRGGNRLVLGDVDLAELRIGGRFRVDDFDGFVRLLEDNYGLQSERAANGSVILRRAK